MYIESRIEVNDKFLVDNEGDTSKDGYMWQKANWTHELGSGKYLYYFEAMGRNPHPFVQALIHADNDEDAEKTIQQEFGLRLELRHIIRKKAHPVRLHDETKRN